MTFVLKDNTGGYVRKISEKPGDWCRTTDLSLATVFNLCLENGESKITPGLPFDLREPKEAVYAQAYSFRYVKTEEV